MATLSSSVNLKGSDIIISNQGSVELIHRLAHQLGTIARPYVR
jgi:hypothetical protein